MRLTAGFTEADRRPGTTSRCHAVRVGTLGRYLAPALAIAAASGITLAAGVVSAEDATTALLVPTLFVVIGVMGPDHQGTPRVCNHLVAIGLLHLAAVATSAVAIALPPSLPSSIFHVVSQMAYASGFAVLVRLAGLYPDGRAWRTPDVVLGVTVLLPALGALAGPTPTVLQPAAGAERGPLLALGPEELAGVGSLVLVLPAVAALVLVVRLLRAPASARPPLLWPALGLGATAGLVSLGVLLAPQIPAGVISALFLVAAPLVPLSLVIGSRPADAPLNHALNRLMRVSTDRDRLRSEVNGYVAELEARTRDLAESRRRLAVAADTERRRVERDLHDGVQQEILAVMSRIAIAQARLPDNDAARADLTAALAVAQDAYTSVRGIAGGIVPPGLADRGLAATVGEFTRGLRTPVTVTLEGEIEALDGPVAAAAYYVVREALTNVDKHAHASSAVVRLAGDGGTLRVEVSDNGGGGVDPRRGSGIRGLTDRVEALGGRVEWTGSRAGTTLKVALPLSVEAV